ncbi:MAG: hypothetical protein EOP06_13755, partial [Proteobacteria bacterium]
MVFSNRIFSWTVRRQESTWSRYRMVPPRKCARSSSINTTNITLKALQIAGLFLFDFGYICLKYIFMSRFFWFVLLFCQLLSAQELALIPQPKQLQILPGTAQMFSSVEFHNGFGSSEFSFLDKEFKRRTSRSIEVAQPGDLQIKKAKTPMPSGSYRLSANANQATVITAGDEAGVFYALQTLFQLLPTDTSNGFPAVDIYDEPTFSWRGMHLDCSRHFFSKDFVKHYIDYLAMYKMNTFHWHLTDDQGWRIEIKKYPKLT